ncbi:MAG: hypothetical protein M1812_006740 [Candelaria pacifica]|nr:MAG: hypothetical protein M1812_006740 [Candelaria pacifica]
MSDFPHQEWIPPNTVGGLSGGTQTTTQQPSLTAAMLWGSHSPTQTSYDQVLYESSYSTPQLSHVPEPLSLPNYSTILPRPKSSPGAFTHNADNFPFASNPPRLKQDGVEDLTFSNSPLITARSPTPYYGNFSVPEIGSTPKIKAPVPIAPDPVGLRKINALKRTRDDYDLSETLLKRRKRSDSMTATTISNAELSSEEKLLLRLKDDENLPWKDIALRFQYELGKTYQVPALQMRYKRLREKLRVWTDIDVQALQQAHEYWDKFRWDIIGAKMLDFGAVEKWPAKYCVRKWEELHPGSSGSKDQNDPGRGYESDQGSPLLQPT